MADRLTTNPIYIDQFHIYQAAVINFWDATTALPAGPGVGDRYLCSASGNGWTANNIYQYNGATWDESVATANWVVTVTATGLQYLFGTSWVVYNDTVLAVKGAPLVISKIIFLSATANDIFELQDNNGTVIVHIPNNYGNADTTVEHFNPPLRCINGVVLDGSDCTGLDATDEHDAVWIYLK
jgi:hypothetical protein